MESDTRAGSKLRVLLRTYDDCVITGDGARYKRMAPDYDYDGNISLTNNNNKIKHNPYTTLSQVNESLLRALANGHNNPIIRQSS